MKNTVECPACGFANMIVKANGKGAMSASCSECGTQLFARSPKASAALRARLGGEPAPAAAGAEKKDDDWLKNI